MRKIKDVGDTPRTDVVFNGLMAIRICGSTAVTRATMAVYAADTDNADQDGNTARRRIARLAGLQVHAVHATK